MSRTSDRPEDAATGTLEIDFADRRWTVCSEGALIVENAPREGPAECWLVIADLHLGKPEALREGGIAVPEAVTASDLTRLEDLGRRFAPQRLVVLGDFVHAALAPPFAQTLKERFFRWRSGGVFARVPIDCVPGNHDRGSLAYLRELGVCVLPERHVDAATGLGLVHDPDQIPDPSPEEPIVWLSGHLHPCVRLRDGRSSSLRLPCLWGRVSRRCLILPAFGGFTGSHPVQPERGDCVVACRDGAVVDVSRFFTSPRWSGRTRTETENHGP